MELTPLRYFIAIADAGHMTRAAEGLGVSQPALSAMLKKLEREVGAPLLDRTGRGVELTAAGATFLERARDAVRQADAAVSAVRELVGLEHGLVRIGGGATATGFILPRVVARVRDAAPGLTFAIRELGSAATASAVLEGSLDLGVVTLPISHPSRSDLLTVATIKDELRLIVPKDHPLAGRRTFRWRDVEHQPIVGFEAGSAVRAVIDEAAAAERVTLDIVIELRSVDSIRRLVALGLGVGFVSRFALDDDEGLSCREGRIARRLAIVRRRDKSPSAAATAFEHELLATLRSLA